MMNNQPFHCPKCNKNTLSCEFICNSCNMDFGQELYPIVGRAVENMERTHYESKRLRSKVNSETQRIDSINGDLQKRKVGIDKLEKELDQQKKELIVTQEKRNYYLSAKERDEAALTQSESREKKQRTEISGKIRKYAVSYQLCHCVIFSVIQCI